MGNVLLWLFIVEVLGLLAFPLAFLLFRGLEDRGYGLSKTLGLLLFAYPSWLLGSLRFLPSTRWSLLLLLGLLALLALLLTWRNREELLAFLRRRWPLLLALEGVFLLTFALWLAYRAYDPAISHTEQPMDFAFLNASVRASFFPPEDPWLSGHGISYYYMGYLMMGLLTKLTGIPSSISYNLALALVPALVAVGAVSLVGSMVRSVGETWGKALGFGLLAVILLLVLGNLEGIFELVRALGLGSPAFYQQLGIKGLETSLASATWYPQDTWWWWRATRVIDTVVDGRSLDYTIHEFPFFSFALGDLHPHVVSLPFLLLALAFGYNLLALGERLDYSWLRRNWALVLVMGLSLGALGFLNFWDLPFFFAFLTGMLALKTWRTLPSQGGAGVLGGVLSVVVLLAVLVVVPYLPFYLGLSSQAKGVLPVAGPVTQLHHLLIVWGALLAALTPFLLLQLARAVRHSPSLADGMVALAVPLGVALVWALAALLAGLTAQLLARLAHIFPGLLAIALVLYRALRERQSEPGVLFTLSLLAFGFLLLIGPELFYVVDSFGTRMNTVFKLYYQGWVALALAGAFALYYWYRAVAEAPRALQLVSSFWALFLAVLFLGAVYYTFATVVTKTENFRRHPTLDGLAYVRQEPTGEYEALQWLLRNGRPGERIAEAVGADYSAYGRVSAATGLATVLGWRGHELQWRGSSLPMSGRAEDVALIYNSSEEGEVRPLLKKYGIRYVLVGPRERAAYRVKEAKFAEVGEIVFPTGDTRSDITIYRVRE